MIPVDLEKLERLAAQATPGPWIHEPGENFFDHDCHFFGYECQMVKSDIAYVCEFVTEANAAYIVAACNAVPELIARVRELERQNEALAFWLAQFLPHAECPIFENCPLSHKKNVDVRDCAKQLTQGVFDHD